MLLPTTVEGWAEVADELHALKAVDVPEWKKRMKEFGEASLYFFGRYIISPVVDDETGIHFLDEPFVFARLQDIQGATHRILDMWARGHGKSLCKTYIYTLWILAKNPEARIGLVSLHKRPHALSFLAQIKLELENNPGLRVLWPDSFFEDPQNESPLWTQERITIKREGNYPEATITAFGILDALPTGHHFTHLIFDDIVDLENSGKKEMVDKTVAQVKAVLKMTHRRFTVTYTGTSYADGSGCPWNELVDSGLVWEVRKHPAIDYNRPNPELEDIGGHEPVLLTVPELRAHLDGGSKEGQSADAWFWRQMILDPSKAKVTKFNIELLETYEKPPYELAKTCVKAIMFDPAGIGEAQGKNKKVDDSSIVVVGIDDAKCYYLLDGFADPMAPTLRVSRVVSLARSWGAIGPPVVVVRVEESSTGTDSVYIKEEFKKDSTLSGIRVERLTRGGRGAASKTNRIYSLLEPPLGRRQIFLPQSLSMEHHGEPSDLAKLFRTQLGEFPLGKHEDVIDAFSNVFEPEDRSKGIRPIPLPRDTPWNAPKDPWTPPHETVSPGNAWMVT